MRRPIFRLCAIAQIGLMLFAGCHPTQPFFVRQDDSRADYLAQSMDIEYADVHIDSLPEATDVFVPFGPSHLPTDYVGMSLEDCMSIALNNAKILRIVGGYNSQTGSTSSAQLSAQPGQLPSIYDPAIASAASNTQPLAIDSLGTRIAPRGAVRSNQVGGIEDAMADFDAQFSAVTGYSTTDRPRNVNSLNVFNPQQFQAVDGNGQAVISKRHATGTVTTGRFTTVYSRNNIPSPGQGRQVPSDYTAALELQVNQPLMRGRGTLVNRIPVMLARMNEELAVHEFEVNVRNLVQRVEHAYWDLYCDYRAFDAAIGARDTARHVWHVANKKDKSGHGEPGEVQNAQQRFYQFEAAAHAALYGSRVPGNDPDGVFGSERNLREILGWGATDGRCIRPTDSPSYARVHFDWHDIVGEALARNVEVRRQKWAIKQDELELISARNQVLPQLDVVLNYRWLGVGDEFAADKRTGIAFPGTGSTALEGLTDGDHQEVSARLEFTPQANGKRRAMANIQSSRLQVTKTQEELKDKEVMLIFELSKAWGYIESSYVLMQDYQKQYQSTQDQLRILHKQYEQGINDRTNQLDLLLRTEETRVRSEVQYFQSVCEYNKAIVNLHTLKGSLLDLNSIQLQEGAWVDKAYWDAEERARERAGGTYFDYGYTRPGVVSNGPIEQGRTTLGNISDNPQSIMDAMQVEPLEESDSSIPESVSPPESMRDSDAVEPNLPTETNSARNVNSLRSGVQTASGQRSVVESADATFEWGSMGNSPQSRQPEAVQTSASHRISDTGRQIAPGGREIRKVSTHSDSSAHPQWNPRSR